MTTIPLYTGPAAAAARRGLMWRRIALRSEIHLFTGPAAHYALQGIDYRESAARCDYDDERGRANCKAWASESFASARTEHARNRRTDRINRRAFSTRNAALAAVSGGAR